MVSELQFKALGLNIMPNLGSELQFKALGLNIMPNLGASRHAVRHGAAEHTEDVVGIHDMQLDVSQKAESREGLELNLNKDGWPWVVRSCIASNKSFT